MAQNLHRAWVQAERGDADVVRAAGTSFLLHFWAEEKGRQERRKGAVGKCAQGFLRPLTCQANLEANGVRAANCLAPCFAFFNSTTACCSGGQHEILVPSLDVRQGEPYSKSSAYRDQHYHRGYHPNLATSPPGQVHVFSPPRHAAGQPSLLLQYRESGLSSSGYELSQYIRDGADHCDTAFSESWSPAQGGGPSVSGLVPPKFSLPHRAVCFGAGGQLVLVCPHSPAEGQRPLVELHSLEVILHGTKEQEELQAFPGPLAREDLHKVDVMTFCQQKIATSCDLSTQRGRDSALLWKLLVLLCRQNGSMVGSDVAELLMQDRRHQEKYKRQNPMENPTRLAEDEWRQPGTLDLITGEVPPVVETQAQIVEKFTKLLYYGRKKDALLWAMRNQLWGHALFLSSKMDPRTYSWVFTSTLATNDPLQTLFQLMSGRIPQVAQSCGDAKWGDWRPHLAVLLSNKVGDMELNHRAIITMGDSLAGRGAVEAAHFCYLMADIPFGYFGVKADRMALLGSSHRQAFAQFASTEAIQRMEIFEYCQQLRQPKSFLLPFQVYKLLYASRLADHGLPAQALTYCEHIATVLLGQDPASHPVLAQQLVKLAERLKLCDPLLLEMPEQDQALEPEWLLQLRAHCQHWEVRSSPGVLPVSSLVVVLCPSGFPFCLLAMGHRAMGVSVWGSPLTELVLCFTLAARCPWALPCATLSSSLSRLSSGSLQAEDNLPPEVALTQPELSWVAASTPGTEGEQDQRLPA
uniref:Protein transport protein sec16 n=1 Tax=Anas zonorhyncha TaxID=75864 RepID=A0A8B9VLQ8_9AVES